jgi:hypothetical protein
MALRILSLQSRCTLRRGRLFTWLILNRFDHTEALDLFFYRMYIPFHDEFFLSQARLRTGYQLPVMHSAEKGLGQ